MGSPGRAPSQSIAFLVWKPTTRTSSPLSRFLRFTHHCWSACLWCRLTTSLSTASACRLPAAGLSWRCWWPWHLRGPSSGVSSAQLVCFTWTCQPCLNLAGVLHRNFYGVIDAMMAKNSFWLAFQCIRVWFESVLNPSPLLRSGSCF